MTQISKLKNLLLFGALAGLPFLLGGSIKASAVWPVSRINPIDPSLKMQWHSSKYDKWSPAVFKPLLSQAIQSRELNDSDRLFADGKYVEAIAVISKLIASKPQPSLLNIALQNRAKIYLVLMQPALAMNDLETASSLDLPIKVLSELDLLKGVASMQQGLYKQSIFYFNKYESQAGSSSAILFSNRAVAYQSIGSYSEAKKDLEKAILISPSLSNYYNLAVLDRMSGNYKSCIEVLNSVLAVKSDYWQVYLQRGLCYKAVGQNELAVADMLRVLSVDRENIEALQNIGFILIDKGNIKPGKIYLEKAAALLLEQGKINEYTNLRNRLDSVK